MPVAANHDKLNMNRTAYRAGAMWSPAASRGVHLGGINKVTFLDLGLSISSITSTWLRGALTMRL